ncbi:hypothetical protein OSB04_015114 [Centaurea solstitialis]|uniref:Reverse transcriptase zinc-binding domain-containing protein n=1 Tax=Centaurea solstitialis TaxID=347529 RepID=A0AA38SYD1_9ASTR|nr:hypothetical protein OSB04_015114 [Centaurea solstitialis]
MVAIEEDKLSLKVLVHKGRNKVIFAEADGNFVNTLFSIMALPLGTIVRVLEKCPDQNLKAIRSLKNLYQSLTELPADCFSTEESKFMMLNPKTKLYDSCKNLKLNIDNTEPTKYFLCENEGCNLRYDSYFSTCNVAKCRKCRKLMTREIEYQDIHTKNNHDDGVFVPNAATFIVTDDLRVMPNTLDLSLGLLFSHGFTGTSHVEERTIEIGRQQMLILVKGAMLLKDPLTYLVFHDIHPVRGLVNPKLGTSIQHLTRDNTVEKNSKTMTLELTLQKSTSKFLFAEAEQDFVDFVFGFLEIPLGTLIGKLMKGETTFKCLENLHESIVKMNLGLSENSRRLLIQPELEWKYVSKNQIFPLNGFNSRQNYQRSFVDGILMPCTFGLGDPKYIMKFKDPRIGGGFLKETTTYMVTDDLVVTRFSSVSAIGILNKLKVPLEDIEHHVVTIDFEMALKILKASLQSSSIFTDVFLEEISKEKRSGNDRTRIRISHGGTWRQINEGWEYVTRMPVHCVMVPSKISRSMLVGYIQSKFGIDPSVGAIRIAWTDSPKEVYMLWSDQDVTEFLEFADDDLSPPPTLYAYNDLMSSRGNADDGNIAVLEGEEGRRFFWGGTTDTKKISWMAWDKVIRDKKCGGLGIGSLHALNLALLMKWRWREKLEPNATWSKIVKYCAGRARAGSVSNRNHGTWNTICGVETDLREMGINVRHFLKPKEDGNGWVWELEPSNVYTVKSLRRLIDGVKLPSDDAETEWIRWVPSKINIFLWRALHNRLPTRDNLLNRGVALPNSDCPLCHAGPECINHLMTSCSTAKIVSAHLEKWVDWWPKNTFTIADFWNMIRRAGKRIPQADICKVLGVAFLNTMWTTRNKNVFDGDLKQEIEIVKEIQAVAFSWVRGRFKGGSNISWEDWLCNPANAIASCTTLASR